MGEYDEVGPLVHLRHSSALVSSVRKPILAKTVGAESPGAAEAAAEVAAPLNRKSSSHAHFCEFCVLCDCSKGKIAVRQCSQTSYALSCGVVVVWARVSQIRRLDRLAFAHVEIQRLMPVLQKVNKTAEMPHMALIDRILDVRVAMRGQVPTIRTLQKPQKFHRPSTSRGLWSCRVGGGVRTVGDATDSVLEQRGGHPSCVLQGTVLVTLHLGTQQK